MKKNERPATDDFRDEEINIRDFLETCLIKWRWFALSVIITLSIAAYNIVTTQPQYTRYTDILIKPNEQGDMGGQMEKFASMGTFRGNTTVFNEIYAMQSPANIAEVVRRLNLDMNYECDGLFHRNVLYGRSLPVKATICNIPDEQAAAFTIDLHSDGTYTLSDFKGIDPETNEPLDTDATVSGQLAITANNKNASDTVSTPLGKIHITPMPHYVQGEDLKIYVHRSSLYSATDAYAAGLSFNMKDKDADIINIIISDQSIERADDILRCLVEVYNENWIKDKNRIADTTSEFIDDRLKIISKELDTVDSNISSYKSKHLLTDVSVAANMYMTQNRDINNKIIDLNNELEMSYAIKKYLINDDTKNKILPANIGISDAGIGQQIQSYNREMLQRNSLVAYSSAKNPLVVQYDNSLETQRQAIITSIENNIMALKTQIANLQKEERHTNERIARNPSQSKDLESAEREQQVKNTLYLFLLQKREENQLSKAFTAYNTRIITPPSGSLLPSSPVKRNILFFALVIGLALPAGCIVARDYFNTKLRGRKDLDNISIPIVGEIPLIHPTKRFAISKTEKESHDKLKIVIRDGSRNIINEAFRVLRTNIEFLMSDKEKNVFICTSFNSGSGKSFTTINLATSLVLKNKKVLIIDGDMRHASLSTFASSPKNGLSNYLSGLHDNFEDIIITNHNTLEPDILPVGTIPPNPTELLENERFGSMLSRLRTRYDYIFIDCPPIDIVADTQIIERHADRTIFIIRTGMLERRLLPELEQMYRDERFKSMSLIINAVKEEHGRYGYRYGYSYHYHEK